MLTKSLNLKRGINNKSIVKTEYKKIQKIKINLQYIIPKKFRRQKIGTKKETIKNN